MQNYEKNSAKEENIFQKHSVVLAAVAANCQGRTTEVGVNPSPSGAVAGVTAGATVGALFGPGGAAVGAVIGGVAGAILGPGGK